MISKFKIDMEQCECHIACEFKVLSMQEEFFKSNYFSQNQMLRGHFLNRESSMILSNIYTKNLFVLMSLLHAPWVFGASRLKCGQISTLAAAAEVSPIQIKNDFSLLALQQNEAWRFLSGDISRILKDEVAYPMLELSRQNPSHLAIRALVPKWIQTKLGAVKFVEVKNPRSQYSQTLPEILYLGGVDAPIEASLLNVSHGFLGGFRYIAENSVFTIYEGLGIGESLFTELKRSSVQTSVDYQGLPKLNSNFSIDIDVQAKAFAESISGRLAHSTEPIVLLGHSYGGLTILSGLNQFFRKHPQHEKRHLIKKVVLLAGGNRALGAAYTGRGILKATEVSMAYADSVFQGASIFTKFFGFEIPNPTKPMIDDSVSTGLASVDPKIVARIGLLSYFGLISRTTGMLNAKGDEAFANFPKDLEIVLVVGEKDEINPLIQQEWLRYAADRAGLKVSVYSIPGFGHEFAEMPVGIQRSLMEIVSRKEIHDKNGIYRLKYSIDAYLLRALTADKDEAFGWEHIGLAEWQKIVLNESNAWLQKQRKMMASISGVPEFANVAMLSEITESHLIPPQ